MNGGGLRLTACYVKFEKSKTKDVEIDDTSLIKILTLKMKVRRALGYIQVENDREQITRKCQPKHTK